MEREYLSGRQALFILFMVSIAGVLITGGNTEAGQNAWIASLISIVFAAPLYFIYSRLIQTFPGKDLFEISQIALGKVVGKLVTLIFVLFSIHLGAMVVSNFSSFVQISSFPETPMYFTSFCMIVVCIWLGKISISNLGRWTEMVFPLVFIFTLLTLLLSFSKGNVGYLQPILYEGLKPVIRGASSLAIFPFGDTFFTIALFSYLKPGEKASRICFSSLILSGIFISIVFLKNIYLLGYPAASRFYYPTYYAASLINIGDFFQRVEALVSVALLFNYLLKTTICLIFAAKGIAHIFNLKDYKVVISPIAFLTADISLILYQNMVQQFSFNRYYKYYALPFEVLIPFIIWAFAEFKKGKAGLKPSKG